MGTDLLVRELQIFWRNYFYDKINYISFIQQGITDSWRIDIRDVKNVMIL